MSENISYLPHKQESDLNNPNKKNTLKRMGKAATKLVAGTLIGATVFFGGCEVLKDNDPDSYGTNDPTITEVDVESGAYLREQPVVTGNHENNVIEKTKKTESFKTENGTIVHEDELNGDWYYIPDKNAWVNSQKADAIRDTSSK